MCFVLRPPRPATGVSQALRARSVSGSVPESVPENRGVSGSASQRVSPGPFESRAPECPKSVPRVSPECLGHLFDTPGTLSGHFLDIPEPGARRTPATLRETLPETPRFSGTLSGTLPETLQARRARETPVAGRGGRKFCYLVVFPIQN